MAIPIIVGAGILAARALAFRVALGAVRNKALKYTTLGYIGSEILPAFSGEDESEVIDVTRTAIQQAYNLRDDNSRQMASETFALLSDPALLWPSHQRGPRAGEPITPNYLVHDLNNGNAWVLERYRSAKSVNRGFQRGRRSGERAAQRQMAERTDIYRGVSN